MRTIPSSSFTSSEDNGYKTVSGHLRITVQSVSDVIASLWKEEEEPKCTRALAVMDVGKVGMLVITKLIEKQSSFPANRMLANDLFLHTM